uniref:t-SNARE coiled-coil homology domain-containing protein n=1 Tax=Spongospora subterranea TaxID=70186 RepID=A0A0H5QT60_9EUKA|eukprot:CRZ04882.1 hypothetical protein [Spongospora subterranea]
MGYESREGSIKIMQNRLAELQRSAEPSAPDAIITMPSDDVTVSSLARYDNVRDGIDAIGNHTRRVAVLRNRLIGSVRDTEQKEIMADLDGVMLQVKREARTVKKTLDDMSKMSHVPGSTSGQMLENMLATHARLFQDAMRIYQEESGKFNDALKGKIVRQAKIVDPSISDEKIEELVESGDPSKLMRSEFEGDPAATQAMHEIEERHQNMLQIDKGVKDIQELFQDMAVLVNLQGETLNVIERNVQGTKGFAEQGEVLIVQAEVYQKKARRQQCIIALILCSLLAILILFFFRPF